MRSAREILHRMALAAALLAAPAGASAQAFSADYNLLRPSLSVQSAPDYAAAGVGLQAGPNWFGQVGIGRHAVAPALGLSPAHGEVLTVGGGYRWSNGQSVSLQFNRGRGPGERLGLAVSYDWPQYWIRFSYDPGLQLSPQDQLRFSAGIRF